MLDWTTLLLIIAIFLTAGIVKGVLGFGLPLVSLGLLTAVMDLTTAIGLLLVPSLVTNLWQAGSGGYGKMLWRRLRLFLSAAAVTIWFGTAALNYHAASSTVLGGVLIVYALVSLAGVRYRVSNQREGVMSIVFGVSNGVVTGITGNFAFPGIFFLQGIGLPRDQLVQAMGILFTLSTVVLAVALFARDLLTVQLGALSAIAVLPALIGMAAGQKLRQRLAEKQFQRLFFCSIAILGLYIISKSVFFNPL